MATASDIIPGRGTVMRDELKPCPFCGGEAAVMYAVTDDGTKTISVVCQKCSIGIFRARTSENDWNAWEKPEKAIAAWNRREGGQDNGTD